MALFVLLLICKDVKAYSVTGHEDFKKITFVNGEKYLLNEYSKTSIDKTMSSLKGYAGIEQITKYKNTYLYRPLLKKSRLEIEQYANNNNIKYFNDYTNETDDYLRNRIRHHIIPYLEKENHNLKESINYFSETLLGANRLIEKYCFDFISNISYKCFCSFMC